MLVRCDFNVPLKDGVITNDKRIVESLPTIKYILTTAAELFFALTSAVPREPFNMDYSLAPVAKRLSELLGKEVKLASDVVGESAKKLSSELKDGEAMLIENVRFHAEEEKNDPEFAKELASLADIYCNDAFGTAHRAHASTAGVAAYLPAVCGYLIQKEISIMGKALENPKRPFVAILGGAKVSTKSALSPICLTRSTPSSSAAPWPIHLKKAAGESIGTSLCEEDKLELADNIVKTAKEKGVNLLLPLDSRCGDKYDPDCDMVMANVENGIPDGYMGLDIGPRSEEAFCKRR